MALSSMGSFSLTAALRSVTFCLVNPGRRVKVGGLSSLPRVFASEWNDATNVRSQESSNNETDGLSSYYRTEVGTSWCLSAFVSACHPVSDFSCSIFGVKKGLLLIFTFFLTISACWNICADSSLYILNILLCTQMKADIPGESFHLTGLMLWWGPHNQLQAQLNLKAIWSTQAPTVKLLTRGCSTTETFLWKRNVILSMCLRIMLSERLQFSSDSTNMTQDFNTEETDSICEDFVKD